MPLLVALVLIANVDELTALGFHKYEFPITVAVVVSEAVSVFVCPLHKVKLDGVTVGVIEAVLVLTTSNVAEIAVQKPVLPFKVTVEEPIEGLYDNVLVVELPPPFHE